MTFALLALLPLAANAQQRDPTRPLRLCAGGDITLGSNLDPVWARNSAATMRDSFLRSADPDSLLAPVRDFFGNADVVLVNVEGAIGEGPAVRKCGKKSTSCYAFRSPPSAAAAIRRLGDSTTRVVGNVANNHSHDVGNDGMVVTNALLDSAGVLVTGADTLATVVVTARGDTVAFLGFYTGADSPDARDLPAVRRHVSRAAASYGIVVVTMHLGAEGAGAQRTRNVNEKGFGTMRGNPVAFAKASVESGATAVIGHGPHVLRAGEWQDSALVLYSLGNLVNFGTFSLKEPMNRGAVACLDIAAPKKVRSATIASTVQIAPGVVLWDWQARSAAIIDSLSRLDFPRSGIGVAPEGEVIRRPVPPLPVPRVRKPPAD